MTDWNIKRNTWRSAWRFAVVGLIIAGAFFIYFETDPPDTRVSSWIAGASILLCPGSFVYVRMIDLEPATEGFVGMWLVIGLTNIVLYGTVGALFSRRLRNHVHPNSENSPL